MKNNKTLRVATLLLALTLITSCVVGATFAKYVTSKSAADGAHVAKWGVDFTLTQTGNKGLFTTSYAEENEKQTADFSVKSSTDSLVAPGTEGNMITFGVTGTPEVSYEVTLDVTEQKTVSLTQGTNVYEPIQWKVKLGNGTETTYDTIQKMVDAVEAYSFYYNVDTGKYHDSNNKEYTAAPTVTVDWAWAFSTDATNDGYDTLLGDHAAGKALPTDVTANLSVAVGLTATATQLD